MADDVRSRNLQDVSVAGDEGDAAFRVQMNV
jgi:hypothetical protein